MKTPKPQGKPYPTPTPKIKLKPCVLSKSSFERTFQYVYWHCVKRYGIAASTIINSKSMGKMDGSPKTRALSHHQMCFTNRNAYLHQCGCYPILVSLVVLQWCNSSIEASVCLIHRKKKSNKRQQGIDQVLLLYKEINSIPFLSDLLIQSIFT